MTRTFFPFLTIAALLVSCTPGGSTSNNSNNGSYAGCVDTDKDTICDSEEGRSENRDTDHDGIPDYLDTDSDGDGINDATEAGDADESTPPVDSDFDGIPDYLDTDSDNNGVSDHDEGVQDFDNDGIPNYADIDNDGDAIADVDEIGGDAYHPQNSDDDAIPDYNDVDSDNDTIGDFFEGRTDSDEDGVPNYRDSDSDNDGIPDQYEGYTYGDATARPIDSDGDGHFDFMDADSDNDGLADGQEDLNHNGVVDPGESDPRKDDTDDDGVSDLIEMAAGTDPQDGADNPHTRGDFVFIMPYQEDPEPWEDVLNFSTSFQKLDLLYVVDVSGSMSEEILSVNTGLVTMLNEIACAPGEDPAISNCIPDVETGIMIFGDGSNSYRLDKAIDNNNLLSDPGNDSLSTQYILPDDDENGGSEEPITALRAGITGTCSSDPQRVGRACFRQGALRLMLLITDEDLDEDSMYNSFQPAYDDLVNGEVRLILDFGEGAASSQNAIYSALSNAQSGGTALVPTLDLSSANIPACNALGGNPFYNNRAILQGADSNAGNALTCAVQAIGAYLPQDVSSVILNDPANVDALGNPVDVTVDFIDYIEVFMAAGDAQCPAGYNTVDSSGDGRQDRFIQILPGDPVCWKIHVKQNTTVPFATEPQMFMATVEVYGEAGALLDTRDVYFLVAPVIEGPGVVGK
ncbi:MSCRAMM family adhesin SdrC [Myxococcota bacterium]|nr:MSCRAMM family adhesin SdrC [Myxococcota bacterium]MBU1534228.1 MSCRAMM family adhesin SdrC [Myxococcota bacterium]